MDELSFDLFLPCRGGSKRVIKKTQGLFVKKISHYSKLNWNN